MSMIKRFIEEVIEEAGTVEEYMALEEQFYKYYGIDYSEFKGTMEGWIPRETTLPTYPIPFVGVVTGYQYNF